MKKHHGNSYEGEHLIRLAYSFRGLGHYHHGGKHGSKNIGLVLEELRVIHLDPR